MTEKMYTVYGGDIYLCSVEHAGDKTSEIKLIIKYADLNSRMGMFHPGFDNMTIIVWNHELFRTFEMAKRSLGKEV